eukprot:scaffold8727_cov47-Attheya_sp.AAC.1
MVVNGCYLFHHGTDKASDSTKTGEEDPPLTQDGRKGHTKGGVAIFLSSRATAAWKRGAGQPEPNTTSGSILGCARFIAIQLHFLDHLGEIVKVNTCSIYHPTGFNQEKRAEFLNTVNNLYEQELDTDSHILISGCDINGAIGIRKSSHCHPDGTIEDQVDNEDIIGPHGIDHTNEPGLELTHLMKAKNLASTTSFFEHKSYITWISPAAGSESVRRTNRRVHFQNDLFLTQKSNLKSIIDARRISDGAPSDHAAVKLVLRLATKLTRKKAKFNVGEKKKRRVKIDWRLLKNRELRLEYNQELREILKKETDQSGCDIPYSYFVKATIQAVEMTIQGEGRVSKDWFRHSKELLLRAINLKNYWFNVWTHTTLEKAKVKLNKARKNLKLKIS